MTIIKLKPVTSERHGENVRRYLNGKDALARDGWNIFHSEHWYAEMPRYTYTVIRTGIYACGERIRSQKQEDLIGR